METLQQAERRKRRGRIPVVLVCVALGIVGDAAIQAILIGPFLDGGGRHFIDGPRVKDAASVLIAKAHGWADEAARRRAEAVAREAARQARIDMAAQDLLGHD